MDDKKPMTIEEFAIYANIKKEMVLFAIAEGLLPALKLSNRTKDWRILVESLPTDISSVRKTILNYGDKPISSVNRCCFCESEIDNDDISMMFYNKRFCINCAENILKATRKHLQLRRGTIPELLKKQSVEKYGNQCYYCHKTLNRSNTTFDHRIPVALGGDDTLDNIVPCCKKCNFEKHDKTDEEYIKEKEMFAI